MQLTPEGDTCLKSQPLGRQPWLHEHKGATYLRYPPIGEAGSTLIDCHGSWRSCLPFFREPQTAMEAATSREFEIWEHGPYLFPGFITWNLKGQGASPCQPEKPPQGWRGSTDYLQRSFLRQGSQRGSYTSLSKGATYLSNPLSGGGNLNLSILQWYIKGPPA